MHQETLLYMWHRLPLEREAPARPVTHRASTAARRPPGVDRHPWRLRHAGRRSRAMSSSAGTTSSRRTLPRSARSAIERHNVTNAQFLEFVEAGGYANARWWRRRTGSGFSSEDVSHPLFWERRRRQDGDGGTGAGMFDRIPLPLAWPVYVSHAEAAAYARWRSDRLTRIACGCRPRRSTSAPRSDRRTGERRSPVGRAAPVGGARRVRFLELGSRARRQPSGGPERLGRRRPGRQRLGMDQHGVCPVSGVPARWRRIRSIPRTSSMASTS